MQQLKVSFLLYLIHVRMMDLICIVEEGEGGEGEEEEQA
jgi:hypothetical protein